MSCPYCKSDESCEHHLLSVDLEELRACGGALYELFNERLEQSKKQGYAEDDDFDESEQFGRCVAEVLEVAAESASDIRVGHEVAGGLASGAFEDYFFPTRAEVDKVVSLYEAHDFPWKNP
jgi:hypothetical protein